MATEPDAGWDGRCRDRLSRHLGGPMGAGHTHSPSKHLDHRKQLCPAFFSQGVLGQGLYGKPDCKQHLLSMSCASII